MHRVQGLLDVALEPVLVTGELSNFRQAGSGHCFFTLKDDRCQLAAVMFRSRARRLAFEPRDGLEVVARGRVSVYDVRGALQLYVDELEPTGPGAFRQELERLRAQLEREGLLAPERKRPVPFLPRVVGVVTALGGAAVHDIVTTLTRRLPGIRIVVRPVQVQGIGASEDVAAGIRDIQSVHDLDVVIVGRGGGSVEDLWAFQSELVARAIVASRIPVVSAVGHEIDVTIADLVADLRAPTPTAAAELVVPRRDDVAMDLLHRERRLSAALRGRLRHARERVEGLRKRLRDPRREAAVARTRTMELRARLQRAGVRVAGGARQEVATLGDRLLLASPSRGVRERRVRIAQATRGLAASGRHRLARLRERVQGVSGALSGLSPLAVLARGYSVVWKDGSGRAVRSVQEVSPGESVRVRLCRGAFAARVERRETEREDDG